MTSFFEGSIIEVAGVKIPWDQILAMDLAVAVAVGIVAGLIVVLLHRGAGALAALRERGIGMAALLLAGGLAVGCLAELAEVLGGDSQDVLFSGQAGVPTIIAESSAGVVVVILLAKAVAYGICLGCGFRGGPVFPAIFIGVALASIGVVALDTSPTLAVAVGTAAGMAAVIELWLRGELRPGFVRQEEISFQGFLTTRWGRAIYGGDAVL